MKTAIVDLHVSKATISYYPNLNFCFNFARTCK